MYQFKTHISVMWNSLVRAFAVVLGRVAKGVFLLLMIFSGLFLLETWLLVYAAEKGTPAGADYVQLTRHEWAECGAFMAVVTGTVALVACWAFL